MPFSWEHINLRTIPIDTYPGEATVPLEDVCKVRPMRVHHLAERVFMAWLVQIERTCPRDIVTYDGGFVPRLKRGAKVPQESAHADVYGKLLSNHSRGTAIDLNAHWNPMGKPGAAAGTRGDVSRIVAAARAVRLPIETNGKVWDAGLVWGGDWKGSSIDPMHFEVGTFEPA